MHDVTNTGMEVEVRENICTRQNVDDYLDLARILFETGRAEESLAILRDGLAIPFTGPARAVLLTTLGWYLIAVGAGGNEPLALGEEGVTLTDGLETCEALIARAKAKSLMAECVWQVNPDRAQDVAMSAVKLFERVEAAECLRERRVVCDVFLESARLHRLLNNFEEAITYCNHAMENASDLNDQLNGQIELGTICREAGRLNEARAAFAKAITYDVPASSLADAYFQLGLTERDLGKIAEARAKVRTAINIVENDSRHRRIALAEFLRVYGYLSYDLDDIEVATTAFRAASEYYPPENPFHWSSLLWLAVCQYDSGQNESAKANAILVSQCSLATDEDRADADNLLQNLR